MDPSPKEPLQIGRVAFAKAFCADWISDHSKTLLMGSATLILLTFLLFQMTRSLSSPEGSAARAEAAFQAWSADNSGNPQLLLQLETALKKDPSLRAKFSSHIAERLLILGDLSKAAEYAKAAFSKTPSLTSPYYSRFSANTLRISAGKYQEALEEAKILKIDLEQDSPFWSEQSPWVRSGSVLYAYNLLRIASLERVTGSTEGERTAWDEFVRNAKQPTPEKWNDPAAYAQLAENFQQGEISLFDFIKERQEALNKL